MNLVEKVTFGRLKLKKQPSFKAGDTVSVHVKVKEGEKERVQVFKGTVLKVRGQGMGKTFTVRKISSGIGVERTFPMTSPSLDQIVVNAKGKVRQSRIFYLRKLRGRASRIEAQKEFSAEAQQTTPSVKDSSPETSEKKSKNLSPHETDSKADQKEELSSKKEASPSKASDSKTFKS